MAAGPSTAQTSRAITVRMTFRRTPSPHTTRYRADELDLIGLAKQGDIRQGDLLVYARTFPNIGLRVEKDLLVSPPRKRCTTSC